ncbi:MAG: hypothetical protein WD068_02735 [Candidatus Babeliales bacterium]
MKQCLRITFTVDAHDYLTNGILKYAKKLGLEGIAQMIEKRKAQVVIYGTEDAIDEFVDMLYQDSATAKKGAQDIEIEPLVKELNFRGVFRVIE